MPEKQVIWILDTSVLLNVLNIPGRNQSHDEVIKQFERRIKANDMFLLPFTAIVETGNHIAQLSKANLRKDYAQRFVTVVQHSLEGNIPWKPLEFPKNEHIRSWLIDFSHKAQAGIGLGDHTIIKHWEEQCQRFRGFEVKIWSLDNHLQGYECNPASKTRIKDN